MQGESVKKPRTTWALRVTTTRIVDWEGGFGYGDGLIDGDEGGDGAGGGEYEYRAGGLRLRGYGDGSRNNGYSRGWNGETQQILWRDE
jgi:hypothetical protein